MGAEEAVLRHARPGEEEALHRIRRRAWAAAYGHIYSPAEIERYFAGESAEGRTWPAVPCARQQTLVGQVAGDVVGYLRWGYTAGAAGEVHSLYVLPQRYVLSWEMCRSPPASICTVTSPSTWRINSMACLSATTTRTSIYTSAPPKRWRRSTT